MFEQVKEMLAKQLKKDAAKITLETKIKEDLGADSLDIMEMLMNIEEDYGTEYEIFNKYRSRTAHGIVKRVIRSQS